MNKNTLITIAVLALLTAGFYYIYHYTAVFKKNDTYYSSFTKISGLQESGPVLINGVKVGKISEIKIGTDKNILITYSLKKDIKIPNGTFAKIINGDVSGTKAVKFHLGDKNGFIPVNGMIPSIPDTTMMELFDAKITPMIKGGKFLLRTVDSSLYDINYLIRYGGLGNKAQQQVKAFRKDFEGGATTSKNISAQVNKLSSTLASLNKSISNASQFNSDIDQKITSGIRTTKNLSEKNYDSLLKQTAASVTKLTTSLKKVSNENKLFKDKTLYIDINEQLDTANSSMQELMHDPSGIQLIGGSKKKNK